MVESERGDFDARRIKKMNTSPSRK